MSGMVWAVGLLLLEICMVYAAESVIDTVIGIDLGTTYSW